MRTNKNPEKEIAEKVRQACIQVAKESFQEASMSGLCNEGAIEVAIGAIQSLDLEKVLEESQSSGETRPHP